MDKLFGLFSSKKPTKKRYENCIITTPINIEYYQTDQVNPSKGESNININQNEVIPEEINDKINEPFKNLNLQQPLKDEVVIVNNFERTKKQESFYTQKYSNKINSLKLSNPIMIERDNMKITFDIEVIDYLLSDMMLIFKEKIKTLDNNQTTIFQGINESRELVNLLYEMYNDSTTNYNIESNRKLNRIFYDIDSLELIINSLGTEVDSLIDQAEKIDKSID